MIFVLDLAFNFVLSIERFELFDTANLVKDSIKYIRLLILHYLICKRQ